MLAVQMYNKGANQQRPRDKQGRPTDFQQAEKGPTGENEARKGFWDCCTPLPYSTLSFAYFL